ncbi:MAG: beta-lactamase family protein, partial [Acidobacteria bacterium]|nr:beta-lactamase family protein [Acidobacteriota bacterium]
MRQLLLAALLSLTAFAQPIAQSTPASTRQDYLDAWRAASGVPGVTVGIVTKDGAVTSFASGESDTATHRKMQPTDLMLAGSTGKTFFAAVAVQLIDEGTLELDAKISKYLSTRPWFSRLPNGNDATVRQLMTHTSGIIRYEFNDKFTADLRAQPDKVWTREEQIGYLFDTQAPFAAGQGWDYSDTNYMVLGLIVEQITGRQYYDLIRDRFLKPFNLTGAVPSDARRIAGLVPGYIGAGDPILPAGDVMKDGVLVINPQLEWAGGGFATNAIDLARWGHELYGGRALSDAARKLMIGAAVPAKLGAGSTYGLGVIIRPPATAAGMTSVTWGHSGYFPGYMSELIYVVDTGTTLAIQINSSAPR